MYCNEKQHAYTHFEILEPFEWVQEILCTACLLDY